MSWPDAFPRQKNGETRRTAVSRETPSADSHVLGFSELVTVSGFQAEELRCTARVRFPPKAPSCPKRQRCHQGYVQALPGFAGQRATRSFFHEASKRAKSLRR